MKKKLYIFPAVEIVSYRAQHILKVSGSDSDLPDDPGSLPSPQRRTEVF